MRVVRLVDGLLLKAVERFARWVNWLTGKDNFWLAKQCACIGTIMYVIDSAMWIKDSIYKAGIIPLAVWFVLILIYSPLAWVYGSMVDFWERFDDYFRQRGTKMDGFVIRIFGSCLVLSSSIKVGFGLFNIAGNTFLIVMFYLICVDKPPYAKSQVREWLRKLVIQPQPSQV